MTYSALIGLIAATLPAPTVPVTPALPAPAAEVRAARPDPVIHVWTDWDEYSRGQNATAYVRLRDDGYVIVLQADVDGRVRVLFPLDPGDDNFLKGGKDVELPGRGGKETFYVDGPGGTAMVYAAVSSVPFQFNDFVKNGHWDYSALYDKTLESDFENGFTSLVNRMTSAKFDYDIYRYKVIAQSSYAESGGGGGYVGTPCFSTPWNPWCYGPNWMPGPYYGAAGPWWPGWGSGFYYGGYGWGFSVGFGWGVPYYGYGYPYYGYGYGYGYGYPYYGYGYPYYGYGYPYGGYRYYTPKGGFPPTTAVGYRPRTPMTLAGSGTNTGVTYRRPGSQNLPTFGTPTGTNYRRPGGARGYTLGQGGGHAPPHIDPRRGMPRGDVHGGSDWPRGSTPYAGAGRTPPPRYNPEAEPRARGNGNGGSGAPGGGRPSYGPAPRGPSAPAPMRGPSAPAPRAAPHPSAPMSRPAAAVHAGGGGRRIP